MKTVIKFLLVIALTAIGITACNNDEPTLDERKQVETVVTPEMLYGTWTLTEMYEVYFIGEDSIVTAIDTSGIDISKYSIKYNKLIFSEYSEEYDFCNITALKYENDSILITNYNEEFVIADNKIIWDYWGDLNYPDIDKYYIAIINNKLWMNTEIIGNRYIFSVFTKQ